MPAVVLTKAGLILHLHKNLPILSVLKQATSRLLYIKTQIPSPRLRLAQPSNESQTKIKHRVGAGD